MPASLQVLGEAREETAMEMAKSDEVWRFFLKLGVGHEIEWVFNRKKDKWSRPQTLVHEHDLDDWEPSQTESKHGDLANFEPHVEYLRLVRLIATHAEPSPLSPIGFAFHCTPLLFICNVSIGTPHNERNGLWETVCQLLGCYRWHEMKVGNWSPLALARCLQSRAALTVMAWGTAK